MRDVVDKVALGQVYLRALRYTPVSIIRPILHPLRLHVALIRKTKMRGLGTFQKKKCCSINRAALDRKLFSFFESLQSVAGHALAQLVEALRYKPQGRGFDSRWSYWNFSVT